MLPKQRAAKDQYSVNNSRRQKGVGLIEVLVTLLILSTSLMTLAALQTRSLQFNHSAYLRSQANILAYDILDRVRINRAEVGSYNIGLTDSAPTGTSLVAQDLGEWRTTIADILPSGRGALDCNGATRVCLVTIDWTEQNSSGEASEDSTTFTYTTQI